MKILNLTVNGLIWKSELQEHLLQNHLKRSDFTDSNSSCRRKVLHRGYWFIKRQDQIVLQFKDKNPNGSMEAITSVCDESGLVCAMMPHPERACEEILGSSDGLNFFKGFL